MNIDKFHSIELHEIEELLNYVANKGLEVSDEILNPLFTYVQHQAPVKKENEDLPVATPVKEALEVHHAYTKLTKITYPVTGKTIIHSRGYRGSVRSIKVFAIFFLIISLATEMIGMYFGDTSVPEDGFWSYVYVAQLYVLTPLSPIFWGGLGSCIFLLKRLSDIAADRTFDTDFISGWHTRVILGAILGGIIQYIYDPGFIVESGMDENALAFLVGLSVKVFYGALEKLIEAVAEKLNLNSVKRTKSEQRDFSELLVKRIAEGKVTEEQRKALLELLEADK